MWERGWSFIKKAGTIILLSTIVIWFTTYFGFVDGAFQMLEEDQIDSSILATIGKAISWIFIPQGFGNWQATVASVTGLVAKENIVGTMGILYGGQEGVSVYAAMAASFTAVSGYAFLAFNLLCAPCFAAMQGGDRLPAERVLCEELGVSRTALRAAIARLISCGTLESRRGSGTYVCPPKPLKRLSGKRGTIRRRWRGSAQSQPYA